MLAYFNTLGKIKHGLKYEGSALLFDFSYLDNNLLLYDKVEMSFVICQCSTSVLIHIHVFPVWIHGNSKLMDNLQILLHTYIHLNEIFKWEFSKLYLKHNQVKIFQKFHIEWINSYRNNLVKSFFNHLQDNYLDTTFLRKV